ncbi:hypothetical protein [Mycolicibacterium fortuitum]|uniref:Uncharacterized protein n=1 Tax=Mycolicibacterium fortuitum TaxID=1766 RepID=A0AAE4VI89_MYCFO|nr:hypothetical protein [Mycolicibacterium fortuitum]MCV7137932.1 hypothetical protein [Mycolicibacterium fortuitum]MDV7194499.1 hypothetical protein [Mycolicibacterium fortuitum]MDV7207872.1 hypothetical protein [Mycolicibacterium fortuitum]MDV7229169.1 hypothetical protein [Mycolicibacterium fortuitum]MDV7260869.1 hypothetical protein [Mycolicibacterium fortuitum]
MSVFSGEAQGGVELVGKFLVAEFSADDCRSEEDLHLLVVGHLISLCSWLSRTANADL